jgi:hypothetical protein
MNTAATQITSFVGLVSHTYGPELGKANKAQLAELLSDCSLEIYCRHHITSYPSKLSQSVDFTAVPEDQLLATAIGAAMRLRLFDAHLIGLVRELAGQHQEFGEPTYEYPDY